jgi:anti-sigma regulatory factor (Ser/Thr protein kinase)
MMPPTVQGRVNQAGQLIAADPALLRLQERAGGVLGGPLMLPQLARLAALALHLQRPITRALHSADDHSDIFAQVALTPDADGVALAIGDWRTAPAPLPAALAAADSGAGLLADPPPLAGWSWECDPQLRLVQLRALGQEPLPTGWQGASLSEILALEAGEDGRLPVLVALAEQRNFAGQRVRLPVAVDPARALLHLSGQALVDARGGFAGFRGWLTPAPESAADKVDDAPRIADPAFGSLPLSDPRFGRRIDGALRGPLSRIVASAETISGQFEGPIRADYARYAGDIAHAARHLLGLIDDLADLQSIERPGFQAAREAVDLADVARRAVGLLAMKAEEKAIRIDGPALDEKAPAVGEFRRVLQVLINLIGNAIRYSPEGSMIWIRCDEQDGMARITVADQGQGLSAEQQAVVFEKFERLGRTDTGGSGLGLYIARRLALAMDGDLTVNSAPGQGARFTLAIPTA